MCGTDITGGEADPGLELEHLLPSNGAGATLWSKPGIRHSASQWAEFIATATSHGKALLDDTSLRLVRVALLLAASCTQATHCTLLTHNNVRPRR